MRQNLRSFGAYSISAAMLLLCGSGIVGCAGKQGSYTGAFKEQAELRVLGFKAGTEFDLARQQYLSGDLDKAIRTIDKSLSMKEDVARSHILRARILIEMDRLENATVSLNRALELDPQSVDAHYFSGILYERFSQFDRAHTFYRTAAELDPTNSQYIIAAAEMLVQVGRLREAEDLMRAHLTRFEHNAGLRQTLGHIALMNGDLHEAVQMFSEAALLAPGDPAVLEDLVRAQIAAGEFAEAEYSLRRLVSMQKSGERRDLRHMLARCLIELDRPVEARDLLLELTGDARGANDARLWIDLANVSMMLEDSARLRQCAARLISITPHQPEGYVIRAMWLHMQGQTESALETLAQGARRCPKAGSIPVLQAIYYESLGQHQKAREATARAIALMPDDPGARQLAEVMGVGAVGIADAFGQD